MMTEEVNNAAVAFVPVSDPMRPLDVFVWDARTKWHKFFKIKGRLTVAMYLGVVTKGYQAWVVSDERGIRISSLPRLLFDQKSEYAYADKKAYRFSGYQPRRGLEKLWQAALDCGSLLPSKKVSDSKVLVSLLMLFQACFDVPADILASYDSLEKFLRVGPFRRIV